MEFRFEKIIGPVATETRALSLVPWLDDGLAYTTCIGSGAALVPLHGITQEPLYEQQIFYHQPPTLTTPSDGPNSGSPRSSPDPSLSLSPGPRLARVNKSSCTDSSAQSRLVAVGESSGYVPRLLLYDMVSGNCLDAVRDLHQFGIQYVKFSPNGEYLASLGTPQDGYLYVWSVKDQSLVLQASNKCITEIKDLQWLNESQFVTAGVRSIKIWTVEMDSLLNGRNVVLGSTADQVFECILPISEPDTSSFLVGTNKGSVYRMPAVELVTSQPRRSIKSLSVAMDGPHTITHVSTAAHIYAFKNIHDHAEMEDLEADRIYDFGTPALLSVRAQTLFVNIKDESAHLQVLNPSNDTINGGSHERKNKLRFFRKPGVQFRTSGSAAKDPVLCWNGEDKSILRWPSHLHEIGLSDITVADHSIDDTNQSMPFLMAGSLSGDVWLDGHVYNAHNGPVTDVHMLNSHLAVSSGRDRCVQVWARAGFESAGSGWFLKQTLLFSTPVLKVRLCASPQDGNKVALVCCGANRTVYLYCSNGAVDVHSDESPAFSGSPRSMLMKGMPFEAASYNNVVILSTNDKTVSIIDPWSDEKIVSSWRPVDSNGDAVNLMHIQPINHLQMDLLLGAGGNKSLLAYNLSNGELMASQWGFGEPLTGIAWTGSEVIAAADALLISALNMKSGSRSPVSLPHPPISSLAQPSSSPTNRTPPLSSSPTQTPSPGSYTPMRKVFNRSRSMSPVRTQARIAPPRSPSPPSRTLARSPASERGRSTAVDTPSSPGRQSSLAFKPLKLSNPVKLGAPSPASHSSAAPKHTPSAIDPTKQLQSALAAFLDQPLGSSDTTELKSQLLAALNKIDGLAILDQFATRISSELRTGVENQINETMEKHFHKKE